MKCLITGITGFVGNHLAKYLLDIQQQVFGFYDDLLDIKAIINALKIKPDYIFHLGAKSWAKKSFLNPVSTLQTNIIGTNNLLEAVLQTKQNPVIHICSSTEIYGQVKPEDIPVKEDCPLKPTSPYAVSKIGEDMLAYQYFLAYGLRTLRTRASTHTGPGRGKQYAISSFAYKIAQAEKGLCEPVIPIGDLNNIRTFCDVRDIVRAYWMLMKCPPGEVYNIGGNTTEPIGIALDILLSYSKTKFKIIVDKNLIRPNDLKVQVTCYDKFNKATGWNPEIPLWKTLKDMLNYWRKVN